MPAVGIAPEWMSEKAIAIACYVAASGVPVLFAVKTYFGQPWGHRFDDERLDGEVQGLFCL